jgi:RNA polymerase sigma factor (sigma-70 family)
VTYESDAITELLERIREGAPLARDELVALLYGRFRQRAHQRLRHERPDHTFTTSDLTHEALLRLLKSDELVKAADRNQLFRAFARAMRQVLIDHTHRRTAAKRGGRQRKEPDDLADDVRPSCRPARRRPPQREELDDLADDVRGRSRSDLLSLHEALEALAAVHPRPAEVLEMHFFGGYKYAEIAEALGVHPRTVERDVKLGKAWLHNRPSPEGAS